MSKRNAEQNQRRGFLGGSDARIIMGDDESRLLRLWQEKRGEIDPEDLSGDLAVQLGTVTEGLNRAWFERHSQTRVASVQKREWHPKFSWMAATLDGLVEPGDAVFEAKFMLPWSFSEEAAAAKHAAQLQHNMLVTGAKSAFLSIITGGGKYVLISVPADPIYQTVLIAAETAFWRCVMTGEPPRLINADAPRLQREAVKIIDMTGSNAWAELAQIYASTKEAHYRHEGAKSELRRLVPDDAKEAFGYGVRAKRTKANAINFELMGIQSGGQSHAGL